MADAALKACLGCTKNLAEDAVSEVSEAVAEVVTGKKRKRTPKTPSADALKVLTDIQLTAGLTVGDSVLAGEPLKVSKKNARKLLKKGINAEAVTDSAADVSVPLTASNAGSAAGDSPSLSKSSKSPRQPSFNTKLVIQGLCEKVDELKAEVELLKQKTSTLPDPMSNE